MTSMYFKSAEIKAEKKVTKKQKQVISDAKSAQKKAMKDMYEKAKEQCWGVRKEGDDQPCFLCAVFYYCWHEAGLTDDSKCWNFADGKAWHQCQLCDFWYCPYCIGTDYELVRHENVCRIRVMWAKEQEKNFSATMLSPVRKKTRNIGNM